MKLEIRSRKERLKPKEVQVPRNEEYIQGRKNSTRSRGEYKPEGRVSSFIFVLGSLIWEPSRGVAWYRPFSSPAFSTYNSESARSVRWAEVGTHYPQSEKPPLLIRVHPHYVLAAPSATPQLRLGPVRARAGPSRICVYLYVCERRIYARSSSSSSVNPSRVVTHTRANVYTQPGTGYRKAEIDNAGGPPAPYPNMDTRPAVAPGPSRRRDGALPSSLPFRFCAKHSAGADATNKSCIRILNPYLRIRWRTYVGPFRQSVMRNNVLFKNNQ